METRNILFLMPDFKPFNLPRIEIKRHVKIKLQSGACFTI